MNQTTLFVETSPPRTTWVLTKIPYICFFCKDLYSVLEKQDLTYMPPEVKGWMDAMHMLSRGGTSGGIFYGGGVGQT